MIKFVTSVGIAIASFFGLILVLVGWLFATTPRPTDIKDCLTTKMFSVRLCPKEPGYVRLSEVSSAAKNAVLVSEDSAFYDHNGVDWFELRQSAEKNWKTNQFARGGSTITQQLAKNVYLSSEKSILRKVRELIITIQLEKTLSKNEILEKYLNVVEFGPNLFGIGKASRFYFGKSPSALTPAEGAFLAFLLPNPKNYSVSFRKKQLTRFAHSQMRVIVDRLYRFKRISAEEHERAVYQVNNFYGSSGFDSESFDPSIEPSAEESADPGEESVLGSFEGLAPAAKFKRPPPPDPEPLEDAPEEPVEDSVDSENLE